MSRKNTKQYLYGVETYSSLDKYNVAKKFFRDVQREQAKGTYTDKGIKQMITRTQNLLNESIAFKGTRKEKQAQQEKFIKSFKRLADKEYFEYNEKLNQWNKREIIRREKFHNKTRYSRTRKFAPGFRKRDYKFSGDVYDYDTFKEKFDKYDDFEKQKVLNNQYSFISGRYSRWSTAVKATLGIDASVSDKTIEKWFRKYEKEK